MSATSEIRIVFGQALGRRLADELPTTGMVLASKVVAVGSCKLLRFDEVMAMLKETHRAIAYSRQFD